MSVVITLALVGAEIADTAVGCGSVDPTDARNASTIEIVNDTGGSVTVDAVAVLRAVSTMPSSRPVDTSAPAPRAMPPDPR